MSVMGSTRWMRVLRGTLASVFATFVAAFSHVLGGGALPSVAAMSLSVALAMLVCIALAGRALSLWRTISSVALSQVLFHGLFSTVMGTSTLSMPTHTNHSAAEVVITTSASPAASGHSASMWLAHAAAAALTVLALRYAEVALVTLRETAGLFFATLGATHVPVHVSRDESSPRIGCTTRVVHHDLSVLFSALRHRGPPFPLAA
jgi:hypothetical protein